MLEIISDYAKTWHLLERYDEQRVEPPAKSQPARIELDYERSRASITTLKVQY